MERVIEYFIPLIASIFLIYEMKILLKIKMHIAFPIGYMLLSLVIYLVYLTGISIPIVVFIGGIMVAPLIVWSIKKRRFWIEKKDIKFLTLFTSLYTLVFLFDYNRGFTHWDEMSHWGPMVKETLRLEQLYSIEASKLGFHKDYPPIKTIFESIWCTLSGGYAEKYIYKALHMMILSILLVMAIPFEKTEESFSIKKILTYALRLVPYLMICIIFTLNDGDIFSTIYADGILAIVAALCLYIILSMHEYGWREYFIQAIPLSFLMLTKQIGFEYYLLCILLLIFVLWIDYRKGIEKKRIFYKFICLSAIPIGFKTSWSTYVNIHQLNGQFDLSKIDLMVIKDILLGKDRTSWYYTGTIGYLKALVERPLFTVGKMEVSYLSIFVTGIIIYGLLLLFNRKRKENHYLWPMVLVYLAGTIGHVVMMWITYMFCYVPSDFLELACYERYMNVMWIPNGVVLVYSVFKTLDNCNYLKKLELIIAAISIVTIGCSNSVQVLKPVLENNSICEPYYDVTNYINANVPEDSSIFIVTQGDNGYILSMFRYLTMPRTYNNDDYSFGEKYHDGDIWTRNYSKEEFLEKIEPHDYMFFFRIDEQFLGGYGKYLMGNPDTALESGSLYKIEQIDDKGTHLLYKNSY